MNKNQVENIICLLLYIATLIIVAMATKSGLFNLVARIFATDIYIQGIFMALLALIVFSLLFGEDRHINKEVPKSVTVGLATIVFLLFAGPVILPKVSTEMGLALLRVVALLVVTAIILFLYSFTIKENKKKTTIRSKLNPV